MDSGILVGAGVLLSVSDMAMADWVSITGRDAGVGRVVRVVPHL